MSSFQYCPPLQGAGQSCNLPPFHTCKPPNTYDLCHLCQRFAFVASALLDCKTRKGVVWNGAQTFLCKTLQSLYRCEIPNCASCQMSMDPHGKCWKSPFAALMKWLQLQKNRAVLENIVIVLFNKCEQSKSLRNIETVCLSEYCFGTLQLCSNIKCSNPHDPGGSSKVEFLVDQKRCVTPLCSTSKIMQPSSAYL